jgi:hypothetical protein
MIVHPLNKTLDDPPMYKSLGSKVFRRVRLYIYVDLVLVLKFGIFSSNHVDTKLSMYYLWNLTIRHDRPFEHSRPNDVVILSHRVSDADPSD